MPQDSLSDILSGTPSRPAAPAPVDSGAIPDPPRSLGGRALDIGLAAISPIPAVQRATARAADVLDVAPRGDLQEATLFDLPQAVGAIPDVLRRFFDPQTNLATMRGFTAGAVEGLGDIVSPLDAITGGAAGALRGLRGLRSARSARVADDVSDSLSDILSGPVPTRRQRIRAALDEPPTLPSSRVPSRAPQTPERGVRFVDTPPPAVDARPPLTDETKALAGIVEELEEFQFAPGKLVREGDDAIHIATQANAPVYRDIRRLIQGGSKPSGRKMAAQIRHYLATGERTQAVDAALDIAARRVSGRTLLEGGERISKPLLDPASAGASVLEDAGRNPFLEAVEEVATPLGRTAQGVPPQGAIPARRVLEFNTIKRMPEDVQDDLAGIFEKHGGFVDQRRGVQSVARTQALADQMTVPLRELSKGQALNAEELAAYQNALASVMTKRNRLAALIDEGAADEVTRLEFATLTDDAVSLMSSLRGATAEAGRSLNILKSRARALELGDEGFIRAALKAPGVEASMSEIARAALAAGTDPVKQLEALRKLGRGSFYDKATAAYYNSLLSGIKTQLRNLIGNTFNAAANTALPLVGAPVDVARARLTGAPREMFLGEAYQNFRAGILGAVEGSRHALFTLKHGFTPQAVQGAAKGAFDAPRVELPGGMLTNAPSRALEAMDVLFRTIARRQETYAGAYAQARKEGIRRGPALARRMSELMTDTRRGTHGQRIAREADRFAARAVFQEEGGWTAKAIQRAKGPGAPMPVRVLATWIAPFSRTPLNILRQGAEFSPLGFGMRNVRAGIDQAGHAIGARAEAQALARATTGTLLMPLAWAAAEGRITGAVPSNPRERAAFFAAGKRPNSIKLGDTWVEYNLFQPLSVTLSAVANAHDAFMKSDRSDEAAEAAFAQAALAVGSSFLDQSFASQLSNVINAMEEPDRYASRVLNLTAQGAIPGSGLLRNVTQAVDRNAEGESIIRRPEGVVESMMAITPGLSSRVPARLDPFGQTVTRPGSSMVSGFVAPTISPETDDPVTRKLIELGEFPGSPTATLTVRGERVQFTREQERAFIQAQGLEQRQAVERVLARTGFDRLPEERQQGRVRKAMRDARDRVRTRVQRFVRRGGAFTVGDLVSSRVEVPE